MLFFFYMSTITIDLVETKKSKQKLKKKMNGSLFKLFGGYFWMGATIQVASQLPIRLNCLATGATTRCTLLVSHSNTMRT